MTPSNMTRSAAIRFTAPGHAPGTLPKQRGSLAVAMATSRGPSCCRLPMNCDSVATTLLCKSPPDDSKVR